MRRVLPILLLGGVAACSSETAGPGPGSNPQFVAVTARGGHACGVTADGAAWCWGTGVDGELGQGQAQSSALPVRVGGSVPFRTISAGESHTCALAQDSTAWCWGWNSYYQRGNANDPTAAAPVHVTGNRAFASISAGSQHTCALAADGSAFCWGYNRYGQLGDGTTNTSTLPVPVAGGLKFRQISAGSMHTCAVAGDGRAYCWGSNSQGQLGAPVDSVLTTSVPRLIPGTLRFSTISSGYDHTCARATDASAYCWGGNEYGQLGDGTSFRPGLAATTSPRPVAGGFTFDDVFAGNHYTCGISGGLGRCWGHGIDGQLGDGSTDDQFFPQTIHLQPTNGNADDLLHFRSIAPGPARFACGLSDEGVAFCWGTGPLGNGFNDYSLLPVRVAVP